MTTIWDRELPTTVYRSEELSLILTWFLACVAVGLIGYWWVVSTPNSPQQEPTEVIQMPVPKAIDDSFESVDRVNFQPKKLPKKIERTDPDLVYDPVNWYWDLSCECYRRRR